MKDKDPSSKKINILVLSVLAAILVAVLFVTIFTGSGDNESDVAGQDDSEVETTEEIVTTNPGGPGTTTNAGISMEEYEQAVATGPGAGTENPPLPSGEPATHKGTALMTAMVSGQTFKIEVAVTVKLDGAGGFVFAYAGTGTVPVNLGANVAATADYQVGGTFTGTVSDGAFTGSGPAAVQATVNMPGMAPQSGNTTEQLTITGSLHEAGEGVIEGNFAGGAYSGTFRAVKS